MQKYASKHIKPNRNKLFMDGVVKAGTGFIEPLYPDRHQVAANRTEDELTDITLKTNIVHLRDVIEPDYKRMADNNIYVTSGMIWHHNTKAAADDMGIALTSCARSLPPLSVA